MKKHLHYIVRPGTGRSLPGAQIRVKASPSTDSSSTTPVYADRQGTEELVQPFLTNLFGQIEFYAPNGRYDVYLDYEDIHRVDRDIDHYDLSQIAATLPADAEYVLSKPDPTMSYARVFSNLSKHPDLVPAAPSDVDDEFDSGLASWTSLNATAATTITTDGSFLEVTHTEPTSHAVGIYRDFAAAGEFSVTSHLLLGMHPGRTSLPAPLSSTWDADLPSSRSFWGVGVRSNYGEIAAVGLRTGAQGISVCVAKFDVGGLVSADDIQTIGANDVYVRIRYADEGDAGLRYLFEWSTNGRTWVLSHSLDALFSGNVVQIGFFALPNFFTDGSVTGLADFIRVGL